MFRTRLSLSALALSFALAAHAQTGTIDAQQFAAQAASGNLFEVESSRLALDRALGGPVADFAQQMVQDHTVAGDRMAAAAQTDGITPPEALSEAHRTKLEQLATLQGAEFETAYITAQAAAHQEAIALFTTFAAEGQDGALRAFAVETLPVLQQHEKMVSELAAR